MKNKWLLVVGLLAAAAAVPAEEKKVPGAAQEWPLTIEGARAPIVLYQPQPESFKNDHLAARAAVSIQPADKAIIFGAVWIEARVETDRTTRQVTVKEIEVSRARFPGATPEKEQTLSKLLTDALNKRSFVISLDRLLVSLDTAEKEMKSAGNLRNDPPAIYFEKSDAFLLLLDGPPQIRENRVVNTPYSLYHSSETKRWRLKLDERFVTAASLNGPWTDESDPSQAVPKIVVSTGPAELIVSKGDPTFTPLPGNELLYMSNTESDVLVEVATSKTFVLLSGRWFSAPHINGPWSFVHPDQLPAVFAKIPPESAKGNVLASVPGTDAAKEALLDAQIPQTATVPRKDLDDKLKVEWDGKPQFKELEGLALSYSLNSSVPVFKSEKEAAYWACDKGVWYTSKKYYGPWKVADRVPEAIYNIPPSCPYYNCRYVHVYNSTPEVVYVGYYPGYMGSYPYYGVVYYGTGYYYGGWYGGGYYYPPPMVTYGFAYRYNPYTGWGVGIGWGMGGVGWVVVGAPGGPVGGWWGPGGIPPHVSHHDGGPRGDRGQAKPTPHTGNNVYADRDGNVSRRTEGGQWQDRSGDGWKDRSAPSRDVQRDQQARDRGAQRASNYQHSGAGRGYSGGGGMRGGGGRGGGGRR